MNNIATTSPIEVRVTDLIQLEMAIAAGADIIGIGDEGCVHRLPGREPLKELVVEAIRNNKRFRLVTPFATQASIEQILAAIRQVEDQAGLLPTVVNSHGVLWRLKKERLTHPLILGITFSNSAEQVAWREVCFTEERKEVKLVMYQHPLNQRDKIYYYREFGVIGAAVNPLPGALASVAAMEAKGWNSFIIHVDAINIGISRSCHTARHYGLKPPDCRVACNRPLTLTIGHYLSKMGAQLEFSPSDAAMRQVIPSFTAWGNMLFRPTEDRALPLPSADHVLAIEARSYDRAGIAVRVRELRKTIGPQTFLCGPAVQPEEVSQ